MSGPKKQSEWEAIRPANFVVNNISRAFGRIVEKSIAREDRTGYFSYTPERHQQLVRQPSGGTNLVVRENQIATPHAKESPLAKSINANTRRWKSENQESGEVLSKGLPSAPKEGQPLSKQRIKGASHTFPKKYREGGATSGSDYADPKNKKYPIHDAEHVRAALSYFNNPKNYGMYTPAERSTMMSRIRRAAKRFGVEVSKEGKKLNKSFGLDNAVFDVMKSIESDWGTPEEETPAIEELNKSVDSVLELLDE